MNTFKPLSQAHSDDSGYRVAGHENGVTITKYKGPSSGEVRIFHTWREAGQWIADLVPSDQDETEGDTPTRGEGTA